MHSFVAAPECRLIANEFFNSDAAIGKMRRAKVSMKQSADGSMSTVFSGWQVDFRFFSTIASECAEVLTRNIKAALGGIVRWIESLTVRK